MSIDWTKPVETRNGELVRVLCTNGRGDNPVVYLMDDCGEEVLGRCDYGGRGHFPWNDNELRNRKTKKEGWICIRPKYFLGQEKVCCSHIYETLEDCQKYYGHDASGVYAKIEWEE